MKFRYAYLLASLIAVIFVRPFLGDRVMGLAIVDLLLFLTLLFGAFAAMSSRVWFIAIASLGVSSALAQTAMVFSGTRTATAVYLITALAFYASVAAALLRSLFGRQHSVTHDTLYQAVSVYLLLGMIGAIVYALLELVTPGSFEFGDSGQPESDRFERFLGFSFTTLTTLGYGNITPANPRADALTGLQAVVGPFYLAVVIARIVAIQVGGRQPAPNR